MYVPMDLSLIGIQLALVQLPSHPITNTNTHPRLVRRVPAQHHAAPFVNGLGRGPQQIVVPDQLPGVEYACGLSVVFLWWVAILLWRLGMNDRFLPSYLRMYICMPYRPRRSSRPQSSARPSPAWCSTALPRVSEHTY